ncbi:amidohydrolase family protein [Chitinimonas sp. BJYL2]|uniref:amidohydrolase family protein n=1 Tax=Chitinimonas sp. BJYL2 TaxID=2976696 RepID=UPI0022B388B2|nr:amidohydrolase family protein [Chitinimonas sp. BJYL2]
MLFTPRILPALLTLCLSGITLADTTLIRDVRVFDGESLHAKRSVLVRDGKIVDADFRGKQPAGSREVHCDDCTLLPGLIDSHIHAYQNAKIPLLVGVTTQIDMFMAVPMMQETKRLMREGRLLDEADLFSAGTMVTVPRGHGTQYGFPIPTLTSPDDAAAFVAERIAEGSDFIKLVYDDGKSFGMKMPTLDLPTLTAAIAAARAQGKLAVVHVSNLQSAKDALNAGAHGLVHLFSDREADDEFVALAKAKGAFVIPTYSVYESVFGRKGGQTLLDKPAIVDVLDDGQRGSLGVTMRPMDLSARLDMLMKASITKLRAAGVPVLAGTDSGNPGTLHGASMHRELVLLAGAGMTPLEALRAATSLPAQAFGLKDRGRIAKGLRADLLLVKGNPAQQISDSTAIVEVWKNGVSIQPLREARIKAVRAEREAKASARPQALPADGRIGLFEAQGQEVKMAAPFGVWMPSLDTVMNGKSTVTLSPGKTTEGNTSIRLAGALDPAFAFPWAGIAFNPGAHGFAPTDLSAAKGLRFKTRGDGGTYAVQGFWQAGSYQPAVVSFKAEADWKTVELPWARLNGFDPKTTTMLGLVAAMRKGAFQFEIADVELML